jgi:hypothetical protein
MKESELHEGDIIFFVNHYKDEKGAISHAYIDHVAMFADIVRKDIP